MTRSSSIYFSPPPIRASDAERDEFLRQLRGHWMAGRLGLDEYEERCAEATQALYRVQLSAAVRELPAPAAAPAVVCDPPRAAQRVEGVAALSLGVTGIVVLLFSMGLLALISLPLSVSAWGLGRTARRRAPAGASLAVAGEILGVVGAALGSLALTACTLVVA